MYLGLCTSVALAKVDDVDLKAVYLFRFALLADWQNTPVDLKHIAYCVVKNTEVSASLESIVAKKTDMARFYHLGKGQRPSVCHILYIEHSDDAKISLLKEQFPHALLVGNGKEFVRNGGMIAFIKVRNRIRPLISRKNVEQTKVLLRSQLLAVSELVKEERI
ncbi:YfiR family protein [Vibrio alfacsensis]|uniref:YfiR family protein n=1 Tax=Vibrio alfacsensis TaxID=1074311 RepID=UPI0040687A84